MRRLAALLVVSLLVAGCSDDEPVAVGTRGDPVGGPLTGTATVLESPEHGPQLCLGGVADSLPPQCGGPDIVGWDWDDATGEESANGTTWGDYTVVGTWADGTFTLTEPPRAPEARDDEPAAPDASTPCPEPAGGWAVVDASTTTQAAQDAAMAAAQSQEDFSGAWVDQSINPSYADGEVSVGDEPAMNDPAHLIVNVRFTGDVARHERELRALWGGALCVSEGRRTEAELRRIQDELGDRDDLIWSSTDVIEEQVELGVVVDDGVQAEMDATYGDGVVDVQPALTPV
jgi:hypothetical protein